MTLCELYEKVDELNANIERLQTAVFNYTAAINNFTAEYAGLVEAASKIFHTWEHSNFDTVEEMGDALGKLMEELGYQLWLVNAHASPTATLSNSDDPAG